MKHLKLTTILLSPILLLLAACNTTQTQPSAKAGPMTMQPYTVTTSSSPKAVPGAPARSAVTLEPDQATEPAPEPVAKAPEPARNDVSPFESAANEPVMPDQSVAASPSSPTLDAEARAFIEETKSSPVAWQKLLSRFDASGDGDIDAAEYARYMEWKVKRLLIRPRFDRDGDGNLDPGTRNAFRDAVQALNDSYFVNPE